MSKSGTIIIVDDNKGVLTAVEILLKSYFSKVVTLSSPVTLITVMQEEMPEESLEELFAKLDQVAKELESGDTSLEESFGLYQKGMEMLKLCNEKIDTVEEKSAGSWKRMEKYNDF